MSHDESSNSSCNSSGLVEVIDLMGRWHLDYGAVVREKQGDREENVYM